MLIAGRRNIRSWMPDQHRSFYANLQIIYVSIRDNKGRPRALALTGPAGFIQSPNSTELTITPQQSLDKGARQPLKRPFLQQQGCECQTVELPSRRLMFPVLCRLCRWEGCRPAGPGDAHQETQQGQWYHHHCWGGLCADPHTGVLWQLSQVHPGGAFCSPQDGNDGRAEHRQPICGARLLGT